VPASLRLSVQLRQADLGASAHAVLADSVTFSRGVTFTNLSAHVSAPGLFLAGNPILPSGHGLTADYATPADAAAHQALLTVLSSLSSITSAVGGSAAAIPQDAVRSGKHRILVTRC
jgi:hypothetical protein